MKGKKTVPALKNCSAPFSSLVKKKKTKTKTARSNCVPGLLGREIGRTNFWQSSCQHLAIHVSESRALRVTLPSPPESHGGQSCCKTNQAGRGGIPYVLLLVLGCAFCRNGGPQGQMVPQSFTQVVNYQAICLKFACCSSAVGFCISSHLFPLDCANSISLRSILNFFWHRMVENCGVAAGGRQIG